MSRCVFNHVKFLISLSTGKVTFKMGRGGPLENMSTVSEINEFEPWLKSAINRFKLNAGLNLEKLNTILNGTNHI